MMKHDISSFIKKNDISSNIQKILRTTKKKLY